MFHSNKGLFFRREPDRAVTIIKTTDEKAPAEDGSNILFQQTLDDGTWGSAVCAVSVGGEEQMRWYVAMDFHNTDHANGYNMIDYHSGEIVKELGEPCPMPS